jgi:pyruvate dehydrogenase E2 component (dihydrolipoamide acetyltransferase)
MPTEFKLPVLGENIESGTVIKVLVSVGDVIENDQPVLELETDKAVLEVPSDVSGTVADIRVKEGATISVGQVVLTVNGAKASAKAAPKDEPVKPAATKPEPAKTAQEPADAKRVEAKQQELEPEETKQAEHRTETVGTHAAAEEEPAQKSVAERRLAIATPTVRRMAREIGVDIHQVPGSGPGGRVSVEDVKEFAKQQNTPAAGRPLQAALRPSKAEPLPDFERWGDVELQDMSSVRRRTAEHMAYAWTTIPHVTQFDKADVTDLERLRKEYGPRVEKAGGKLTMTAFLIKIVAAALQRFPQFNATIDVENEQIIYKKYYNVGVAVDTDRGLLVPVIRDADKKSVTDIAVELAQTSQRTRDRKLSLEDMQGGTFTITNLGGIGGTAFTPIVNAPEVAILGVSRSQIEPAYINGAFQPRTVLPLSLSYDHRIIDGADAARFLRWVSEAAEQPFLLFLEG